MKDKRKKIGRKSSIVLNIIVIAFLISFMPAIASTDNFVLTLRMVKGYENGKTYTYSSSTDKRVILNAQYSYSVPEQYSVVHKFNELHVSVYKRKKILFVFNKWGEYKSFQCNYQNDKFSLDKSIYLDEGQYGFAIWRTREEAYYDKYGQEISKISVIGNVQFK